MNNNYDKLVSWLFDTRAIRICPENNPFWYTSGTIGPYYINTHFLYGSEEKANSLLKIIDEIKGDKLACPEKLMEAVRHNYKTDAIFHQLIDMILEYIKNNINLSEVSYISGGERRDWFFSLLVAEKLGLPHITIYKDLSGVVTKDGNTQLINDLDNKSVLHIADLITEASSYERAWIPAIKSFNGNMKWSLVVVDRLQGGEKILRDHGVSSYSMINIDGQLFDKVVELGYINQEQYNMVIEYLKNPKQAMTEFLKKNPQFLQNALSSDEKTKERARLCVENKIYNLDV